MKKGDASIISVIICTHNRSNRLLDALHAIENQTLSRDNFELIVVNDGSTDNTAEIAEKFKEQTALNAKVVHQPDSGSAVSRNQGLKHVIGDIIAFTDDDCIPDNDWLEKGLKYFLGSEVDGVEGVIYSSGVEETFFDGAPVTPRSKQFIGGRTANMFYGRDVLLEVGGFDERFVMPFGPKKSFREDTDLAWRVKEKGAIVFADDVKVFHPPRPLSIKGALKNQKLGFLDGLFFLKYPKIVSLKMIFGPKTLFFLKLPLRLPFFFLGFFYFLKTRCQ